MDLIGELLVKTSGSVYTPATPRVTDGGHFGYNLLQLGGTTTGNVAAVVEHRNRDEDTWTNAGSFLNAASTGLKNKSISAGLKELTRFKFTLNSGSSDAWARVAVLPPVWTAAAAVSRLHPLPHPILNPSLPTIHLRRGFQGPTQDPRDLFGLTDPPDPQIAVGGGYVLTVVNGAVHIYSTTDVKKHIVLSIGRPGGIFPSYKVRDARCFFDNYANAQRFVIAGLELTATGTVIIWFAVSKSSDPTAGWYVYWYDPNTGADYTGLGYDDVFYSFVGANTMYVWPKAPLLAGSAGGITNPTPFLLSPNPQPVQTLAMPSPGYQYVMQRDTGDATKVNLYAIDHGLGKTAVKMSVPSTLPDHELPTCSRPIQGAFGRMEQTIYRNGVLWLIW